MPTIRCATPTAALLAAMPLAWLMPQHYLPWLTAQQDFVVLALLAGAGLAWGRPSLIPRHWGLALFVALASLALHTLLGMVFVGDAALVALYLLALGGAIALGAALGDEERGKDRPSPIDIVALATTAFALLSIAVGLMQWTATAALPLPVATILPGDRPYGNFAQANHFNTAAFLGLASLGWLRETRLIGPLGWHTGAAMMVLGMVASGSRTAVLQLLLAAAILSTFTRRASRSALSAREGLTLLAVFAALTAARPRLDDWIAPAAPLPGTETLRSGDLRGPLWTALLDAIGQQPWTGYGWLRTQTAQYAVALDHTDIRRYFESGHNLVIDLTVWLGIPLAALLLLLALSAAWKQTRTLRNTDDPRLVWGLIGIAGVVAHSMVEYPFAYAYFLVPTGIAIGVLHGLAPAQAHFSLGVLRSRIGWVAFAILLAVVAFDYLRADSHYRTVRMESTFGARRIETPRPDLFLLTQLDAYLHFIHTEARPGMGPLELQRFREVAKRYGHPPVLLRLALAEGLNGDPHAAREALLRVCAMHTQLLCDDARASWVALQQRYPQLAAIAYP
jgi:hypothetical protein